MKKTIIACLLAAAAVTGLQAGPAKSVKEVVVVEQPCKYRDTEFQLDAFGTGAFYNSGRPGWGGGLGANLFFLRYLGIGVEQGLFGREAVGSSGGYAEWSTMGNFYLRYPICSIGLSPYLMAGGGAVYGNGNGKGVGHVGGGLEYRFTDNVGIFTDSRWLYSGEEPRSGVLTRMGFRFAF